MAQPKELGYVELVWTCPVCKNRNPGTQGTCVTCGLPQPPDVQFETPSQAELLKDEEKIAHAQTGADIHCGFCGARNPAAAKVCRQCGADLTAGTPREAGGVVGAFGAQPHVEVICPNCGARSGGGAATCSKCGAPLVQAAQVPAPAPKQPPVRAGGGFGCAPGLFIALAVMAVLGAAGFLFLSLRTEAVPGVVQEARWERAIVVEGLASVKREAWRNEVPADAEIEACRPAIRRVQSEPAPGAVEQCGTPYVIDTGTGVGRVVQECEYQIYDDMCTYSALEWQPIDLVTLAQSGTQPVWPQPDLDTEQRLGERREQYTCVLEADGVQYSYTSSSAELYEACQPGTAWNLQINSFGSLVGAEPR